MKFDIGSRIAYERKKAGFTQAQLANKIYLSRANLSRFEKNQSIPSEDTIQNISKTLSISIECFKDNPQNKEIINMIQQIYIHCISDISAPLPNSELKSLEKTISCFTQEISVRFLLAAYYYKQYQFEKADMISDSSIASFLNLNIIQNLPSEIRKYYYLYIAEKNYVIGNFKQSLVYFELLILETSNEHEKNFLILKTIDISFKQAFYGKAFTDVSTFIENLKNSNESILLAKAYIILSAVMINLQLFNEALDVLKKVEMLIEKYDIKDKKIAVFQQRGRIYSRQGLHEKALFCFEEASLFITNPQTRFLIYNSIISTLIILFRINEAKEKLSLIKSFTLGERERMIVLSYEGQIALYEGDEKTHWKYQDKAIQYFKANNCYKNLNYIYTFLGNYYFSQNKYKESANYYKKKEKLNYENH